MTAPALRVFEVRGRTGRDSQLFCETCRVPIAWNGIRNGWCKHLPAGPALPALKIVPEPAPLCGNSGITHPDRPATYWRVCSDRLPGFYCDECRAALPREPYNVYVNPPRPIVTQPSLL